MVQVETLSEDAGPPRIGTYIYDEEILTSTKESWILLSVTAATTGTGILMPMA